MSALQILEYPKYNQREKEDFGENILSLRNKILPLRCFTKKLLIMKKLLLLCIAVTLTGVFSAIQAQDRAGLSDKALSAQYKHEIEILDSEIKTLKLKLKADKANFELQSNLDVKQSQLKEIKSKKKIIDDAIKSKSAAEKAEKKADKAAEKAEKAKQNAEKRAADAQKLK